MMGRMVSNDLVMPVPDTERVEINMFSEIRLISDGQMKEMNRRITTQLEALINFPGLAEFNVLQSSSFSIFRPNLRSDGKIQI